MKHFFNSYTALLLFLYACTLYIMTDRFNHQGIEAFGLTLFLFVVNLGATIQIHHLNNEKQKRHQNFIRYEFIVMSLVFFISSLVITLIHHNNADVKGWWVFYLNFYYLIGVIYSSLYCFISYLFSQKSARYTCSLALFSFALLVLLTCISPLANDRGLCNTLVFLLTVHFILCVREMIKKRVSRLD